jgi:NADPH:quinone reductase-like Zn-dependent oxidoreductase
MFAYSYSKYGPPEVLTQVQLPKPFPGPNEVLIENHATTVSSGDWRARSLTLPAGMGLIGRLFFGINGPRRKILGTELTGVVAAVGADVTQFEIGQEVIAFPGGTMGAYAQFVVMPEDGKLVAKPENLTKEEAAGLCFGGTTAYDYLANKAKVKAGDKVLINGASGSTGSACVQIAKYLGADVTGVCSEGNADFVRNLGADHMIDYATTDFTEGSTKYDIVVDTVGNAPWARAQHALTQNGKLVIIAGSFVDLVFGNLRARFRGKSVVAGVASEAPEILRKLATLVENGDFRPVIDRVYPFDQMVDAHAYVDTGRKKGSVVVLMSKN